MGKNEERIAAALERIADSLEGGQLLMKTNRQKISRTGKMPPPGIRQASSLREYPPVSPEETKRCRRCGAEKKKSELHYGRCRKPCRVLEAVEVPDDKCAKCGLTSSDLENGRCEDCRPKRTGRMDWRNMTDEEVVQFAKDLIASEGIESRSVLQGSQHSLYVEIHKRGLIEKIGLDPLAKFGHGKAEETNNPPEKHCYLCRNFVGSDLFMRGVKCSCGCHLGGSR